MSELTKRVRETQEEGRGRMLRGVPGYEKYDPAVVELCKEHERLEADIDINAMKIRQLQAEHERICNEHALLVQESGREGRELDRLEGLLRAWGLEFDIRRRDAVYAEAVRLAKESE